MVTKLKEVDAVIVGLGWTGGILAKELTQAGLKVVALERGALRTTDKDYSVPNIRDELRYVVRHDLMQDTAKDTLTVRNNPSQEALPMRRLGSFLPGDVVGGSGVHWSGHTWRWTDMEFKVRSMYEERYGKSFIPEDMTIQDWGITYDELEPYYEKFEYTAAVSGKAGNLKGQIQAGGNPFEAPRQRDYALPPLTPILASEMFATAAKNNGYNPFPRPSANDGLLERLGIGEAEAVRAQEIEAAARALLLRAVGRGDGLREIGVTALHVAHELAQRVDRRRVRCRGREQRDEACGRSNASHHSTRAGTRMSRLPLVAMPETSPDFSICSSNLAARL